MERSHFATVKEAFAADLDTSLAALGITKVKGGNRQWQTCNCPCCTDSDGSCSISKETGFINCKQCSRKLDLFEWWREVHRCKDDWEACHQVGDKLGIAYEKPKKKKGRAVGRMTVELLDQAIHNLLEGDEAQWARDFFKKRKLWKPQILARFGVGFLGGCIIFAQWDPDGSLRDRYRKYNPHSKKGKWGWSTLGGGGPVGFWPACPIDIPANAQILLCEGEMDVLAAWIMGELHLRETPICAFTWTGGAGSPVQSSLMPPRWEERHVYICYDNDTYQGPDFDKARAPNPKKLREMGRRRETMIRGVVQKFVANHHQVTLLHVDIDPVDRFGADYRDWCDDGRKFDELPGCAAADLVDYQEEAIELEHHEVFDNAQEFVAFQGSVVTIERFSLVVPITSTIDCPAGSKNCCRDCPVMSRFTDQEIVWADHRKHLLKALLARDTEAYIIRKVIAKPSACNECSIHHEDTLVGAHWTCSAEESEGDDALRYITVISTEAPSLSGSMGITGYAEYTDKSVGVLAVKLDQLDKPDAHIDDHLQGLLQLTPWASTDQPTIDAYLERTVADYTHNITKIYGRPELHIGTMLVAHSALWYELDGHRFRGWLDACFFGGTRLGKSETIKRLLKYWRLGESFTCMENFSRAGLTVGGAENGSKMKPGLWPKNNRKLIFLDEFHHMAASNQNVMVHLQSARDEGKVSAVKVYGDVKLPAAVRLITAGNWAKRTQSSYQFFCQHLQHFYGVPEALSRMDFAWCVHEPVKMIAEEVPHEWSPELARALILRAWALEPHQIHLADEVVELAKQVALEWDSIYAADDLALHTGVEKHHSIIRIAIAIANICFSHPDGKPAECEVRLVHVEWAIAWLVHCWQNLQYDQFSQRRIASRTLSQPTRVEIALTVWLDLGDPDHASSILPRLTEANSPRSLQALIMGCGQVEEPKHYYKWLQLMLRYGAIFEKSENQFNTVYLPTQGCLEILHGLIALARDDPDQYAERQSSLSRWDDSPESKSNIPGIGSEPDLPPLTGTESDYDEPPF